MRHSAFTHPRFCSHATWIRPFLENLENLHRAHFLENCGFKLQADQRHQAEQAFTNMHTLKYSNSMEMSKWILTPKREAVLGGHKWLC